MESLWQQIWCAYYGRDCDSTALFSGYQIAKSHGYADHINHYDVLKLDITTFRRDNEEAGELLKRLNREVISELREMYGNALQEGENYLPSALADINNRTGDSFIIIIDGWDSAN